jgi:excisionase family DNA binding protein
VTISDRLRQIASALPSDDSAVTFTRADLVALLDREGAPASGLSPRDLTCEEVGEELGRSASTVRTWLIAGELRGYKLNRKSWRIPREALREYLDAQARGASSDDVNGDVDITAWRKVRAKAANQ